MNRGAATPQIAMDRQRQRRAMLLMVVTAIMWSMGGIFIKLISWSPFLIAGVRSLISGAVMAGYMRWRGIGFKWNRYSLGAGIGLSFSATLFTIANKLTTAANAIVLQYTAPVFILILSAVLFRQKLERKEVAVVAVTMVGMVLFFFDRLSPGNVLGNIFGILAGVFLALMFVMVGRGGDDDGTRMSGILIAHILTVIIGLPVGLAATMAGSAAVTGAAGSAAVMGAAGSAAVMGTAGSAAVMGAAGSAAAAAPAAGLGMEILYVVILGVFQLGIPYVLYGIASRDCPPLACSLIGMLEPLLNPVWVAIFIGEVPGLCALIGAAIILVTVGWWCVEENRS